MPITNPIRVSERAWPTALAPRRGMASILILLSLPVVLLFAWFCIEYARVHKHAGRAKLAADAAALAAAARFADGPAAARADAVSAAAGHEGPKGPLVLMVAEGPAGGGDLEFGDWDPVARTFSPNAEGGKAARASVRLAEDHPNGGIRLLLAGLFDIPPASVVRTSVAVFRPATHTTSLLLADSGASTVELGGTSRLRARGGVSVPNASADAVSIGADASVDAPVLRAAGSVDDGDESRIEGTVQEGSTVPADPFAGVEVPAIDVGSPVSSIEVEDGQTVRLAPGLHAPLSLSAGTVVLEQGLHQFTGGISLSGSAELRLENATVQLPPGAGLELLDSAAVRGTCASGHPSWNGVAFVQRPGAADWAIGGAAVLEPVGRVYAPGANLQLTETAEVRVPSAVLRSVALRGASRARLSDDIAEIALPAAPGRARLIR